MKPTQRHSFCVGGLLAFERKKNSIVSLLHTQYSHYLTSSPQMCGVLPPTDQFSSTSWRPTFSSVLTCLQGENPHVKGTSPARWLPHFKHQLQGWEVTRASDWLQIGGSHALLLRFGNLLEWLTELGKTVYLLGYWFPPHRIHLRSS